MDDAPSLHPALEPLAFLIGTWRGPGTGKYPGIDEFGYVEESRFWHYGRPVLAYSQRTWSPASGAPMHSETGYFRPVGDGVVEAVLAHSFGVVEIQGGRVEGAKIALRSESLTSSPTANRVDALTRKIEVAGGVLTYEVEMAFGDSPLQPHLSARLERVSD